MATKKSQRIGIMVIAFVMLVGTIGTFAVMMLSVRNQSEEAAIAKQQQDEWQKKYQEYQDKVDAQADELSKAYYPQFQPFASRVGEFDRDSVNELRVEDIKEGDGAVIDGKTAFAAYYILWLPDGKISEQSIEDGKLKSPLPITAGLDSAGLIDGWKEGMKGMKIGGIRELTIPSDMAYKEEGSKDATGQEKIPPNTPLKFIVMAVPEPEQIPMPDFGGMLNG